MIQATVTVTEVYRTRPRRVVRDGGMGSYAFNVSVPGAVKVERADTREAAEERRAQVVELMRGRFREVAA